MNENTNRRPIRSFVRREGRITPAQQKALDELLPRFGVEFTPALLDLDRIFGRRAARVLEVGFGNGDTLLELARRQPERDFLGIEVYRPGVGRLLHNVAKVELVNVRVSCHDAVEVLARQIPDAALQTVLLYFPDPWPKKRHHKRRIVQPAFVELVTRKLQPGGRLQLATDWENYAWQMLEVLGAAPGLRNCSDDGTFVPRPPERPLTRFEQRGRRLGHEVRDLVFEKIS